MKQLLTTTLLFCLALCGRAQSFDFDMTRVQPIYSDANGAGYDIMAAPDLKAKGTAKSPARPFFFSVKVPDGNYTVRVVLGSKKRAANTTVRAENRRLMVENTSTAKGKTATFEFVVNKREPKIDAKNSVKIKERERDYLTWDDRLTLEFNGDAPAVQSIHIERNDKCPTIYLCGNSTVVDQSREPWASWGQMITRWFDSSIVVSNHAESGLTTTTFLGSNRLDKILATLKAGDYVLCEFGHNDEKDKRPGSGAWYNFSHNLKIFLDQIRAKGATMIVCTPTQRRNFIDGKIKETHGDYPAAVRAFAKREHVALIDLTPMTTDAYLAMGEEGSKRMLVHYPANTFPGQKKALADNTHFNPFGAYEVSKMIVMGMKQLGLPLVKSLRPEFKDFDPKHPDSPESFIWHNAVQVETAKPDGN